MNARSSSPSPPPYSDPERQQLLVGSKTYSGQVPPDGLRANKRADSRSRSRLPADGSSNIRPSIWMIILLLFLAGFLGFYSGQPSESERNGIRERIERFKKEEEEWRQKVAGFEEEWQRKVDEETRKRDSARLYWDDIKGDEHCLSNGRKKYTARLANLPASLDAMEACKFTPITLNGVIYDHPISCEHKGSHGVRGHWVADNEGVCAAYWEYVKTKDCTAPGSGYRRFEAKLGVIHAGESPEMLCLTTPLNINGKTYSHPLACPNWGSHGYWGIWNIPDDQCK